MSQQIIDRLQEAYRKYRFKLDTQQNIDPDQFSRDVAQELDDIRHEIEPGRELRVNKEDYHTPYNVSSDMELEGIVWPQVPKFTSGQIDSSSTGDTVLLTGVTNKMYVIQSINMIKIAGTTQSWQVEIDTGASFATTRVVSENATDDDNHEMRLPKFLGATERIVINVKTAVASSTIDWDISYIDFGFGTVWAQT